MNGSCFSFDADRHELLDGLKDADRVAIASTYNWDGGRVESRNSGGWISARLGEGAGGGSSSSSSSSSSSGGGGGLSGRSAAPLAPPERVGVKDLCDSEEEEKEEKEEKDGEGVEGNNEDENEEGGEEEKEEE
jgi:hypothetical protein